MVRPFAPKSQAAWNLSVAFVVTQILSCGIAPRTMVQAEAQSPSMMIVWPECRRYYGPSALFPPPQASASDYSHDRDQRESTQQFRAGTIAQCVGCQAQRILARGDRLFSVEISTGAEQSGGPDYLQGWSLVDPGASQRESH